MSSSSSSFSVKRLSENWVKPCKPTQCNNSSSSSSSTSLVALSSIDKNLFPHCKNLVNAFLLFKHGKEPAKIIREALSKALVLYFPVAGEYFLSSEQGELEIACTDRGVWFVEASANCTIDDVAYCFDEPCAHYTILEQHLLPQPPPEVLKPADLFLLMQVTEFKCEGFVVVFRFNHVMFDGAGIGQLMKAIGELARGFEQPTVHPIWCRDDMPILKPRFEYSFPPPGTPKATLEGNNLDISLQHINQLKNSFIKQQTSGSKKTCTTFEVLAAKIWRSRQRAIKTDPDVLVQLEFVVNFRSKAHFKHGLLPKEGEGYYGNCIYTKLVEAPCRKIIDGSFSEVVELIQEAKRGLPSEIHAWMSGGSKPRDFLLTYDQNLLVVDWINIGFNEVDYGWGVPQSVAPANGDALVKPVFALVRSPKFERGVRLSGGCVKEEHLEEFLKQMSNFDLDDH